MSRERRVLVVHPDMNASGGRNVVAAYTVEALKGGNEVTVLSWAPADLGALNSFYGTSLKSSELETRSAPLSLRVFAQLFPYLTSFKYALLLRMCKKMRGEYDVMISLNNESDFGQRGIQYVHDPPYWLSATQGRPRFSLELLSPRNIWSMFKGRQRPWMLVAGFSYDRMRSNLTLVNSRWTGGKVENLYGMRCLTVYPPVPGPFPDSPWEGRENGFVCIGRIAPWKRIEKLIEIIEAVRSQIRDVHLHIIGTTEDRIYRMKLLRLAQGSTWLHLSENVSRKELVRLVSRHRYGIHGMVNEPFGIAVAEMLHGGCIVFVPRNGGPKEIVGGDERLLYETNEEAVRKILRVMKNRDEQRSILRHLRSRKALYSTESFVKRIREIVTLFPGEIPSNSNFPGEGPAIEKNPCE
jgi:hypothetical protein